MVACSVACWHRHRIPSRRADRRCVRHRRFSDSRRVPLRALGEGRVFATLYHQPAALRDRHAVGAGERDSGHRRAPLRPRAPLGPGALRLRARRRCGWFFRPADVRCEHLGSRRGIGLRPYPEGFRPGFGLVGARVPPGDAHRRRRAPGRGAPPHHGHSDGAPEVCRGHQRRALSHLREGRGSRVRRRRRGEGITKEAHLSRGGGDAVLLERHGRHRHSQGLSGRR
mmetsp:Transcript_51778/g.149283  ORF Transcript_51778/g.149283 Transcript_51778/m.149283 type:complete len:226 (-) Transcript_51778:1596-2273(-)